MARELKKEFPDVKGFSARNLWNIRNFYITYQADEKLQTMIAEISWTKNILINHVETHSYETYLLNQTNFEQTVPEQYREQAKRAIKDE